MKPTINDLKDRINLLEFRIDKTFSEIDPDFKHLSFLYRKYYVIKLSEIFKRYADLTSRDLSSNFHDLVYVNNELEDIKNELDELVEVTSFKVSHKPKTK